MDFKSRLYKSYSKEHVQLTAERLPQALQASAPYLRDMLRKWVPRDRTIRVLDLGCGYGSLLYVLRELGYQSLAGVDVSPDQVGLAHHLGFTGVVCGEIAESLLELPEDSMDVVFAFDVLEHLTRPELLQIGDLVARVLRPEGRFIVHVPNGSGLFSGFIRYGDLTHELAFTPKSLRQFGNTCGFALISVSEDRPVPHGIVSAIRAILWKLGTLPFRILLMAESPQSFRQIILSQNLLAVFAKAST